MPDYLPFIAFAAVATAAGLLLLGLMRIEARHRRHALDH
jgi:hypothetical protein